MSYRSFMRSARTSICVTVCALISVYEVVIVRCKFAIFFTTGCAFCLFGAGCSTACAGCKFTVFMMADLAYRFILTIRYTALMIAPVTV